MEKAAHQDPFQITIHSQITGRTSLEKEVELRQWQLNIMFNNMKDAKVIDVLLKAQDALEKAMFVMESQDLMVSDAYDAAKEALNEITELLNSEA